MGKNDILKGRGTNADVLTQLQRYSLAGKIAHTERKIVEYYLHFQGKVYISFSGGKDSTVLLHIARRLFPDIPAVFVDTGLEFPEIREFVKTTENVEWLKPKMTFNKVIDKYGYPIISKEQAQYIDQYRRAISEKTKDTRWNGNKWGRGKISEKWKYMVNAPFRISEQCCNVMKKKPISDFEKRTGLKPIIGTMASESSKRVQEYNRFGCNSFDTKRPTSKPISIWSDKDVWDYIKKFDVPYASIYDMGYLRTGCVFCGFGCHIEKESRFERLKNTHPKLYKYCMDKLGLEQVMKWYLDSNHKDDDLSFYL